MKDWLDAAKALGAACYVGVFYGAVAGAMFGTVAGILYGQPAAAIFGAVFGFCFGCFGGLVFGAIGGALGSVWGWTLAGFVGGLVAASCLEPWRPNDCVTIGPAFVLAATGSIVGRAQQREDSRLPLLRWMAGSRKRAVLLRSANRASIGIYIIALFVSVLIIYERCTAPALPMDVHLAAHEFRTSSKAERGGR